MSRALQPGCYSIGADPVICSGVGCVVGAEALGEAAGVWVKTHFYRQGHFLCATVYAVAAGNPRVVELRVDLRPILRSLVRAHAVEHSRDALRSSSSGKVVGWSLGKMWKKAKSAAKAIGRSKLVKGVVSVTKAVAKGAKAVVKSKIMGSVLGVAAVFPLTAAIAAPALGAYAAANAAIGSVEKGAKVVKVAANAVSSLGRAKRLSAAVKSRSASANAAVKTAGAMMSAPQKAQLVARAKAAAQVKLSASAKAKIAQKVATLPTAQRAKVASGVAGALKQASALRQRVALAQGLPPAAKVKVLETTALQLKAAPEIAKAKALQAALAKPGVQKQLVTLRSQAETAKGLLEGVQSRAQTAAGPAKLDAQKSAVIVNLVARNRARIQAMSQAGAGGLPGMLITPQGKLVRGKFRVQPVATAATRGGLLYQGRGQNERGTFAKIAGAIGQFLNSPIRPVMSGELPMDGIRVQAVGPASREVGPYEVEGCGGGCGCAPCSASA